MLALLEERFQVLAPDLPGFGHSPALDAGTPPAPEALTDALERDLDAAGWDRPHVAGSSLGGWIALELARRGRVASVVAISPAGMWTRRESLYAQALLKLTRLLASAPAPERALGLWPVRVASGAIVFGRPARGKPAELAEMARLLVGSEAFDRARELAHATQPKGLNEISVPTLIAWGTRDRLLLPRQARRFVREIPGAELRWLDGLGHLAMQDDPELVARTIAEWIRQSPARPAAAPA